MASIYGLMDESMMENGRMENNMGKDFITNSGRNGLENGNMGRESGGCDLKSIMFLKI